MRITFIFRSTAVVYDDEMIVLLEATVAGKLFQELEPRSQQRVGVSDRDYNLTWSLIYAVAGGRNMDVSAAALAAKA